MTDRHQLEVALRNAMADQGYLLVRDPDAGSMRQEGDGYAVLRLTDVLLGWNYGAALEDVAAWAKREVPDPRPEEVPDPRPEDERILLAALHRFFGALDSYYDSGARLEALKEDRAKYTIPAKRHYRKARRSL